jgi:hypothetical protein
VKVDDFEKRYQQKHKKYSIYKSSIRMVCCLFAIIAAYDGPVALVILAGGLLIAEVFGVFEELI